MTASTATLKIRGYRGSPWVTSWYPFKGYPKVSAVPDHHGQADPVFPEKLDLPESEPVRHQNPNAPIPVYSVLGLLDIQ